MMTTLAVTRPTSNGKRELQVRRPAKWLFLIDADNGTPRVLELAGRQAWAMQKLLAAGDSGCTPIKNPGPRWSHYIWKLRGHGVDIQTLTERHEGKFPGYHARYVLRSKVRPASVIPENGNAP